MTTLTQINTIIPSGDIAADSLQDELAFWNYLLPTRNILYFTFDVSAGSYINSETSAAVAVFNATQKDAARAILSYVSSLIGVGFSEVSSSSEADVHFGNSDVIGSNVAGLTSTSWDYSYAGAETLTSFSADAIVYLDDAEFFASNNLPTAGTSGYQVLLHEIGHVLGLGHPFAYKRGQARFIPIYSDLFGHPCRWAGCVGLALRLRSISRADRRDGWTSPCCWRIMKNRLKRGGLNKCLRLLACALKKWKLSEGHLVKIIRSRYKCSTSVRQLKWQRSFWGRTRKAVCHT